MINLVKKYGCILQINVDAVPGKAGKVLLKGSLRNIPPILKFRGAS